MAPVSWANTHWFVVIKKNNSHKCKLKVLVLHVSDEQIKPMNKCMSVVQADVSCSSWMCYTNLYQISEQLTRTHPLTNILFDQFEMETFVCKAYQWIQSDINGTRYTGYTKCDALFGWHISCDADADANQLLYAEHIWKSRASERENDSIGLWKFQQMAFYAPAIIAYVTVI